MSIYQSSRSHSYNKINSRTSTSIKNIYPQPNVELENRILSEKLTQLITQNRRLRQKKIHEYSPRKETKKYQTQENLKISDGHKTHERCGELWLINKNKELSQKLASKHQKKRDTMLTQQIRCQKYLLLPNRFEDLYKQKQNAVQEAQKTYQYTKYCDNNFKQMQRNKKTFNNNPYKDYQSQIQQKTISKSKVSRVKQNKEIRCKTDMNCNVYLDEQTFMQNNDIFYEEQSFGNNTIPTQTKLVGQNVKIKQENVYNQKADEKQVRINNKQSPQIQKDKSAQNKTKKSNKPYILSQFKIREPKTQFPNHSLKKQTHLMYQKQIINKSKQVNFSFITQYKNMSFLGSRQQKSRKKYLTVLSKSPQKIR